MKDMVLERLEDGTYRLNSSVVFHCGCGGIAGKARRIVQSAGCDVPMVMTTTNNNARLYIKQELLENHITALRKSRHMVLYNPFNKQYINLLEAKENQELRDNIFKVVNNHG